MSKISLDMISKQNFFQIRVLYIGYNSTAATIDCEFMANPYITFVW